MLSTGPSTTHIHPVLPSVQEAPRTCESVAAVANGFGGNLKVEPIAILETLNGLKTIVRFDPALEQPEAVVESHAVEEVGRWVEGRGPRLGVGFICW